MAKICSFPTSLDRMANGAGLEVKRDINGQYQVRSMANKAYVYTFPTEQTTREGISEIVDKNLPDLSGNLPFPSDGVSLSPQPPRFQGSLEEAGPIRRSIIAMQQGPLGWLTPMPKFSQILESSGIGPAWSRIVRPTQEGKQAFDRAMARDQRAGLGGRTYNKALREDVDKPILDLSRQEREWVTLVDEAYSKQEIERPGVLLEDGMNRASIDASTTISKLGMAHRIPELTARNALVDSFLANRDTYLKEILPKLDDAMREGRLPQEFAQELGDLRQAAMADVEINTWLDAAKVMGLSQDEVTAMAMLRSWADDPERFNLPAIFRHSTAPVLEEGFESGRQQFISKMGMSPKAVQIADARMRILSEAYEQHGFNARQLVGAQAPIFRQFMDAGIMPGVQFGENLTPQLARWANVTNQLPEGTEVFTRRVLSGHLNPRELHPSVSANKHVRNLLMRDNLDGPIAEAHKIITDQFRQDPRIQKILNNYLHELQGRPSEGMQNLNRAIRGMGRIFGKKFGDREAEHYINLMNFTVYTATMPFRAALIMRNFYQVSMGLPIIGPDSWMHGFRTALGKGTGEGFSRDVLDAAWDRAIKGGALDPETLPIHAATEALGAASRQLDDLHPAFARAGFNVKELFNIGLSAYRFPDDFGRVAMFEAGRHRVGKNLEAYMRGSQSREALEQLKVASKVKTFNEAVEDEFERLILADRFEEAKNLIGKELSDKVHFQYGNASHPAGWGGIRGKLLGQFGTFPVQYANQIVENLSRGTIKDRAEYVAGHTAINAGIIWAGAEVFDMDLSSWAFYPSLRYTGGPYAEAAIAAVQAVGGSDAESALARNTLKMMLPGFTHPSPFVPGSYFIQDIVEGFKETDELRLIGRSAGFRFMDPGQKTIVDSGFGWLSDLF